MPMSLRMKFNLVLALVCLAGFLAAQHYVHGILTSQARAEVSGKAQVSMAMALAVREHTSRQVKPFFDAHQGAMFAPQGIPAFAAKETMRLFNAHFSGHSYREVALNPTNPADLAVGWEKTLLERYRSGAISGEYEQMVDSPNGPILNLARPLQITDVSCLACHGKTQDAPPGLLAKYGNLHGFGWKMQEIIGAQILSIPADEPMAKARAMYRGFIALLGGSFLLLFTALNIALYRLVLLPMSDANRQLQQIAEEDALTGTRTRRRFLEQLEDALQSSKRGDPPLSVITFDIDHFKHINDRFGHAVGDQVLQQICQLVMQTTKRRDHLGRLGGEEFALLLPATALAGASALAQSLCESLAQLTFAQVGQVTASFGVAQSQAQDSVASLLQRADESLYRAKANGRNCVGRE